MSIQELITLIKTQAEKVEFDTVINCITKHYDYTPCRFTNGSNDNYITNDVGTNEGSCKIFSFSNLNNLDKNETLACFGKYYRDDVLKHPERDDHGNIRTFMIHGWDGIRFDQQALKPK